MIWISVLGALALAGVVTLVVYAGGLRRKVADVGHETRVTVARLTELRTVVGRIDWSTLRRD